ncbi:OmpA family protein [Herbaspirillum rubrisubalbicans]|uniref:OmpA family protein n=1 Tax=Herbaspirillum rubrisubalbicans TaxID=80842 RepID=A0AAD0XIN3_9BURK|nr:OmpA family protein [Herbaspirillum rubrisubalbicans]AYR25703.1 OmpA family protein [Herbaspirillum rubrisubalbicans]
MNKVLVLMALVLAGCAGPKERFVLLPQADGSASSIVVKTATGETTLSTPYAATESIGGKLAKTETLAQADVEKRYAEVLGSLPARPRSYDLLFELGTDRLTPASQELLKKAMAEIKDFPAGEFILTGHADNIGSDTTNDALSLRRARLIERELQRAEVKALSIEVVGKGARDPRVPQKRGVPEPRNRFVEIKIR